MDEEKKTIDIQKEVNALLENKSKETNSIGKCYFCDKFFLLSNLQMIKVTETFFPEIKPDVKDDKPREIEFDARCCSNCMGKLPEGLTFGCEE